MKNLILLFLFLIPSLLFSQEEGIDLNWEKFTDLNDYELVYDDVDTTLVVDTLFAVKYKSVDTFNIGSDGSGGTAFDVRTTIVDSAIFVNRYLDRMIQANDELARLQVEAMRQRAIANSYKAAYEELTGVANARLDVYDKVWPLIDSLTFRNSITDTAATYYTGVVEGDPNTGGVLRDSNSVIIARIFPWSYNLWSIAIANNGDLGAGESDFIYSENGRNYLSYSTDPEIGRIVIILDNFLR